MRRSRSEDGDEQVGGAGSGVVAPSSGGELHPVLTRPAFLSHIFKFVVRRHKDFKLIHVHTAWEDTAVNYSPRIWSRLLRAEGVQKPPPLEGTPTVEEVSQHFFNHFVCTVLAPASNYTTSPFSRLVAPRVVNLNYLDWITDSALVHLGKRATITELYLSTCNISDAGLAYLSGLQLQKLNLKYCGAITDAGLHLLLSLRGLQPPLQMLDLAWCDKITDAGLKQISGLQQLQSLDLCGCKVITDAGLQHIATLQQLQALWLSSCDKITDAGLLNLGGLRQLQTLGLAYCDKISDDGLRHISGLRQLQTLGLAYCRLITDDSLRHISGLQQLQTLNLEGCKQITDAGLQVLGGLQQIQTLNLAYCDAITDAGLHHIAGLPLKKFWAYGCRKITAGAKVKFKQAHPNCAVSF
jgi:hypothetical protein